MEPWWAAVAEVDVTPPTPPSVVIRDDGDDVRAGGSWD